jgi:hypothetical protein
MALPSERCAGDQSGCTAAKRIDGDRSGWRSAPRLVSTRPPAAQGGREHGWRWDRGKRGGRAALRVISSAPLETLRCACSLALSSPFQHRCNAHAQCKRTNTSTPLTVLLSLPRFPALARRCEGRRSLNVSRQARLQQASAIASCHCANAHHAFGMCVRCAVYSAAMAQSSTDAAVMTPLKAGGLFLQHTARASIDRLNGPAHRADRWLIAPANAAALLVLYSATPARDVTERQPCARCFC